jgi:hypothetical protein
MGILSNEELKNIIKENSTFKIETQYVNDNVQVAVWAKTFGKPWGICYQDGDMNGNERGTPIFDNPGADDGLRDLRDILKERAEFQHLIHRDTVWYVCDYEPVDELIREFCEEYAEANKIADIIKEETEED